MLNGCYLPEQNSIEKNNNCKSNIKKKSKHISSISLFYKVVHSETINCSVFLDIKLIINSNT